MKEPYVEGLATHNGPKSCAVIREGGGEALSGVYMGRVLSRESELQPRRPASYKRREAMVAKLALLKEQIRKRMHAPIPVTRA